MQRTVSRAWIAAMVVAGATGCGSQEKRSAAPSGKPDPAVAGLIAAVPGDAIAIGVLSLPAPAWDYLGEGALVPMSEKQRAELEKELQGFLDRRLGLDVRGARSIVAFARGNESYAVLIGGVRGKLKGGPRLAIDPELPVVVAQKEPIVAIGTPDAVDAALATLDSGNSLAKAAPEFAKWIASELGDAPVGAALRVDRAEPLLGKGVPKGIANAAATVTRSGIRFSMSGDHDILSALASQLNIAKKAGLKELADARAQGTADEAPTFAGAGTIIAYHMAVNLFDKIDPKVEGDRFTIDVPGEFTAGTPLVVGAIGVMAAVAIPAFMKYIKRSKASEPRTMVREIAERARARYAQTQTLPASVGPTPPSGSCCEKDDGVCPPDASLWNAEPWRQLDFRIEVEHRYSYEVRSAGSQLTVLAQGDLDCDGVRSTFSLTGQVRDGLLELDPDVRFEDELE